MPAPQMKEANGVQFFTNKMCPFAQKVHIPTPTELHDSSNALLGLQAWVALEEKGVAFELVEIGLYGAGGKPSWFLEMNPKGSLPTLISQDVFIN